MNNLSGIYVGHYIIIILLCCNSCHPERSILAEGGNTDYVLLSHIDHSYFDDKASNFFQSQFEQISGAHLNRVDSLNKESKRIIICPRSRIPIGSKLTLLDSLEADEFMILHDSKGLAIVGGSEMATLNGVIHFLSEFLGCRWYAADEIFVPRQSLIALPYFEYRYTPIFEYRDLHYPSTFDSIWSVMNFLTPHHRINYTKEGPKVLFYPYTHSFYKLVPPRDHFDSHPEYYSLVAGKRTWQNGQLCLSNPDVRELASRNIVSWLDSDLKVEHVAIDQMDHGRWCECSNCRALVNRKGGLSGYVIDFVDDVSERVIKKYPDTRFTTLAYLDTEEAPLINFTTNTTIRLSRWGYCNAHALDECYHHQSFVNKPSVDFREKLYKWKNITDRLYIWDYHVDFSNYLMPYPNFRSLGGNIGYYRNQGVAGVFAQGSGKDYSQFSSMNAWVLSRLLWNPALDAYTLRDEFCQAYYKEASHYILDYLELLDDLIDSSDAYLIPYSGMSALSAGFLIEGESLLEDALKEVKNDSVITARVEKELLCHQFAQLEKSKEGLKFSMVSKKEKDKVRAHLSDLVNRHRLRRYREVDGEIKHYLNAS